MRIHVFSGSTRFTGGRVVLYTHANALARAGHSLTLYVTSKPSLDWMPLDFPVQQTTWKELPRLPKADLCLMERYEFAWPLIRANIGTPVLVCQGSEWNDLANRIRVLRSRPDWPLKLPRILRYWFRLKSLDRAYRSPSAKIAINRPLVDQIRSRYGQEALYVPNGLPDGLFSPPADRSWTGLNVLVVGPSDTACKRIPDALEAIRLLKQQLPGVRLLRVASHPMRDFERQAGVTDEYHTMVPRQEMAKLYARADVVLLTSDDTEGFGLPFLEAMACGTPVVATDIPGFRCFAEAVDYAHFAPVAQPQKLAEALKAVLCSTCERQRLSQRGVEVASEYTMANSLAAMASAVASIAGDGQPAGVTMSAQ